MNEAELKEMKEDRLANFAVAAFLGSLLMGQALGMWEGSQRATKLLMFTVPDYSGLVILAFMSSFFILSLFLATASIVPPLQRWGLATTRSVAPVMLPIVSVSFVLSWMSSTLELPDDQWWTPVLFVGGFGMFLFIGFRRTLASLFSFLRQRVQLLVGHKPVGDAEPDGPSDVEPTRPAERAVFLERIRSLRRHARLPQPGEFWITLSVAVAMVEVVLVFLLWDWLTGDESGSATIRNIGLVLAGSLAIPLAIWRAVVADKQASSTQQQTAIAQQGLLNERYQKAAEMLGSEVLSVRMGGVYALQRLAEEHSAQYHVQVIRLLCAFVRNPAGVVETPNSEQGRRYPRLRDDVQAAMSAIAYRSEARLSLEREVSDFRLDLYGAHLRAVELRGANLRGANLTNATLEGAHLTDADLSEANLSGVNLCRARLASSKMSSINLIGAPNLSWIYAAHADLSDARIGGGADMSHANLTCTNLSGAHISDADFSQARLFKTNLSGVRLAESTRITASDPPVSERLYVRLTQDQLDQATSDPERPPQIHECTVDVASGKPLVWHGAPA